MLKERLMTALGDAVGHRKAGMDDCAAVIKAAGAHDFNPDQTRRLSEMYNTAKTLSFFKRSADRTLPFNLVDPDKVLAGLFSPEAVAPRKEAAAGLHDYSFYDSSPKHESVDSWSVTGDLRTVEGLDTNALFGAATVALDGSRKAAEAAISAAEQCDCRADILINDIANELWREDMPGYDKQAEALKAFGDELPDGMACGLIDTIRSRLPKRASWEYPIITDFDSRRPDVMAMFKELVHCDISAGNLRKDAEELSSGVNAQWAEFTKAAGLFEGVVDDQSPESFLSPGLLARVDGRDLDILKSAYDPGSKPESTKPSEGGSKGKGTMTSSLASALTSDMAKGLGAGVSKQVSDMTAKALTEPTARAHVKATERIKNMQRGLILDDLINNDPEISGADPEDVSRAYQTIIELSPETSLRKDVVRSVLREMVNTQAVSPYDAKTLTDLETSLQKRMALGREFQRPGTSVDVKV